MRIARAREEVCCFSCALCRARSQQPSAVALRWPSSSGSSADVFPFHRLPIKPLHTINSVILTVSPFFIVQYLSGFVSGFVSGSVRFCPIGCTEGVLSCPVFFRNRTDGQPDRPDSGTGHRSLYICAASPNRDDTFLNERNLGVVESVTWYISGHASVPPCIYGDECFLRISPRIHHVLDVSIHL